MIIGCVEREVPFSPDVTDTTKPATAEIANTEFQYPANPYYTSPEIKKIFDDIYYTGGRLVMARRSYPSGEESSKALIEARDKYYVSLLGTNCPYLQAADCGSIYKLTFDQTKEHDQGVPIVVSQSPGSICSLGNSTDFFPISKIVDPSPLGGRMGHSTVEKAADWFFSFKCIQ